MHMDNIRKLVKECVNVKPMERSIIISDSESRKLAELLSREARADILFLENFGERPLKEIPVDIKKIINNSDVVFYVAKRMEGEHDFREKIKEHVLQVGRYVYIPGADDELLEKGLSYDYKKIDSLTKRLQGTLEKSKKLRISENGTKLDVVIENPEWLVDSGMCHSIGEYTNIPAGELSVRPTSVNGIFSVSMIGNRLSKKYGVIEDLVLEIKDNVITNMMGDRQIINSLMEDLNGDLKIEKIGFGTNIFINEFTGNFDLDKKMPIFHIYVGKESLDIFTKKISVEILEPIKFDVLRNGEYTI